MLKNFLLFLLTLFIMHTVLYAEEKELTINHVEIATVMFYDGKYDKALEELQKSKDSHMQIEWDKYHSIRGMIALKKERYTEAIVSFKEAIEAVKVKKYESPAEEKPKKEYLFSVFSEEKKAQDLKEKKPLFDPEKLRKNEIEELYIYLSQAYYKAERYRDAANALDAAGDKGRENASMFTMKADCYWKAGKKGLAIDALSQGNSLFPQDTTLLKQKFYYFAELKLFQAAIEAAKAYMNRIPASEQEFIALAQMLMGGGEPNEAVKVLEEAKLKFPASAKLHMLLGHYYNQKKMTFVTANLFEKGACYDRRYLKEAAEMYRRLGDLTHALYLNSKMTDKAEKTKQQVAIYVGREEFEKIIALKDALDRYGLLNDDAMRYALAYAYYVSRDYGSAETHLKKIQDDELFSKATIIRKNIEKCKNNPMECL